MPLIVHASCVHTAVSAANVSCAVRETSTFAAELLTSAADGGERRAAMLHQSSATASRRRPWR
jgi:hypothetical protein